MSRYKQIISGEKELQEISGVKWMIYPTIESRMELLELVKKSQMVEEVEETDSAGNKVVKRVRGRFFNLGEIAKTLSKMVFEACFEHNGVGKRTKKKEDELDTTELQILELLLQSEVLSVYFAVLEALNIIDKNKSEEIRKLAEKEELKKNEA